MARRTRRFWSEDEKRRIVAQTYAPGVSVSQVGRRYDINANLIFKWRRDPRYRLTEDGEGALSFLPVEVAAEPALAPPAASDGRGGPLNGSSPVDAGVADRQEQELRRRRWLRARRSGSKTVAVRNRKEPVHTPIRRHVSRS